MSNQKQLGLATMQYTQDYDETLPSVYWSGSWHPYTNYFYAAIFPYVKNTQVYICPSRDKDTFATFVYKSSPSTPGVNYKTTYITNYFMVNADGYTGPRPVKLSMLADAATLIGQAETRTTGGMMNDGFPHVWNEADTTANGQRQGFPHFDGANYMFLDGHSKWYSKTITGANTDANAKMWGRKSRTATGPEGFNFTYGG